MNWNDIFSSTETMLEHKSWADPSDFAYALDFVYSDNYPRDFDDRVKKFYVVGANWICTDSRVGLAVYMFDGVPVAVSAQSARRSDETVEFVSIEAASAMREYILSHGELRLQIIDDLTEKLDQGWFKKAPPKF